MSTYGSLVIITIISINYTLTAVWVTEIEEQYTVIIIHY